MYKCIYIYIHTIIVNQREREERERERERERVDGDGVCIFVSWLFRIHNTKTCDVCTHITIDCHIYTS